MPLSPEDYMEPACPLSSPCACGKEHGREERCGNGIPMEEIIARCDELFNAEKTAELGELLRYWRSEAQKRRDRHGELGILSEMMGHYRMAKDPERGMEAIESGIALLRELGLSGTLPAGTILLNGATALQSFGKVPEALSFYAETARIYERHLDPADWRFAGLYNNMAAAYEAKGEFPLAEKCYLRALDVLKLCANNMDSAVTCLNLAQLYKTWHNDMELVENMLEIAMEFFNMPDQIHDGYYAHTCRKCASGFGALGRRDLEDELNKQADLYYERH